MPTVDMHLGHAAPPLLTDAPCAYLFTGAQHRIIRRMPPGALVAVSMKSLRIASVLDLKYTFRNHYRTQEAFAFDRTAAAAMSALDGAGAVHSMLSYELCERGVLVQ